MNFALIDSAELLAAVVASGIVLVAPGYAMARVFRFSRHEGPPDLLAGILVGLAILPVVYSLAIRSCGLDAALAIALAFASAGVGLAVRGTGLVAPSRIGIALIAGWLALLMFEWIDFDIAGKLYAPLTIFDTVKHAATTQAIYNSGAPPRDAFFLRPERSSYYYFFYSPAALTMRLCGGAIDAKSAVGGLIFWTGLGAFGLVRLTLARLGLDTAIGRRTVLILAVMAAGGLDMLAVLFFAWTRSFWMADPLQWNDVQVGAWFEDILWVPHHLSALIAGTVGLVALTDLSDRASTGRRIHEGVASVFAGICFASSLGLSIWVTFGFVVTIAVWVSILGIERRWRLAALVLLAGLVSLVIAVPQLMDLKAGRAAGGPAPIALAPRMFMPVHTLVPEGSWQIFGDILCLPLNYGFEFGVLLIGSLVYWRQRRTAALESGEFQRVLAVAAISCLVLGAFLRSTLFNNDLGWRVTLIPLLAGTVWTLAAVHRLGEAPRLPAWTPLRPALYAMMGIGWATVLYTVISMRAYPFVTVNKAARFIAADPATARDLRVAYGWVSAHLAPTAVLQQNPTRKRTFAFGIYGRNPISVADSFGSLYGADPREVTARIAALAPIFEAPLSVSEVGKRAVANGIDEIVITAADPVWAQPGSFVWREKPIFSSARVRIIPVVTLEAAR